MAGMKAMNSKKMDMKDIKLSNPYDYEIDSKIACTCSPCLLWRCRAIDYQD